MKSNFTSEQIEVLKAISRTEWQYQRYINSPPKYLDIWVRRYFQIKPVLDDLHTHGIKVLDVSRLDVVDENTYKKAVPILVKWYKTDELSYSSKNCIVSILILNLYSKAYAFDEIIKQYKSVNYDYKDEDGRWDGDGYAMAMENAFIKWMDDSYAPILFAILAQSKFQWRLLLYLSFTKFKKPENKKKAVEILIDRLKENHDQKVGHPGILIEMLRKLKAVEAKDLITEYLADPNGEIRREAKKTIAAFDKLGS
jgi:hypothetical protein